MKRRKLISVFIPQTSAGRAAEELFPVRRRIENMEEIIFWMEDAADSGVKKIADKVAGDVELVTDRRPRVLYGTSQEELADVAERAETVIVPATVGKSRLLEQMEEEKRIGLEQIRGKRECYGWFFLNDPEWHGTQILLIAGSDKRGTIYGLFHLSELLGVSPFVDWCADGWHYNSRKATSGHRNCQALPSAHR